MRVHFYQIWPSFLKKCHFKRADELNDKWLSKCLLLHLHCVAWSKRKLQVLLRLFIYLRRRLLNTSRYGSYYRTMNPHFFEKSENLFSMKVFPLNIEQVTTSRNCLIICWVSTSSRQFVKKVFNHSTKHFRKFWRKFYVSLLKTRNETFLKNTKRLTHILWHFKNENYQVNTQRASYRRKRYILKKCEHVTIQCNWPTKFQILIANRPGENCLYRSKIARAKCHQIATK